MFPNHGLINGPTQDSITYYISDICTDWPDPASIQSVDIDDDRKKQTSSPAGYFSMGIHLY